MPDARPLVVRDLRFREHRGPTSHPERPERLEAIDRAIEPLECRTRVLAPRRATPEEILRAHDRSYVDALFEAAGRRGRLDADTFFSERSVEVARLAAGASVELVRHIARGGARDEARRGLGLVRPPGHHAETDRAMGFCLLNNVAIAARALQAEERLERIAVVDWDVHHGNGTQHQFEAERDVLFVSLHQFPFYPGSGALDEIGLGNGRGATLNLPLPAGTGDAAYLAAFDTIVLPVLAAFRPELLLVSAGFDAHVRDPLGEMRVSTRGFAGMARRLRDAADALCGGRLALLLEGGYDASALGDSVAAVLDVLCGGTPEEGEEAPAVGPEWERIAGLREAHSVHWSCLRDASRT